MGYYKKQFYIVGNFFFNEKSISISKYLYLNIVYTIYNVYLNLELIRVFLPFFCTSPRTSFLMEKNVKIVALPPFLVFVLTLPRLFLIGNCFNSSGEVIEQVIIGNPTAIRN